MDRVPKNWQESRPSFADENRFGTGRNGYINSDTIGGTPATRLDERFANDLQESIVLVIEAAGLQPNGTPDSPANHNQLLEAFNILTRNAQTDTWIRSRSGGEFLSSFKGLGSDGAGRIAIVGDVDEVIQTSDDNGDTWTNRRFNAASFISDSFTSIAHDQSGTWVAVGRDGIFTSPDGIAWTKRTAQTPHSII